MMKTNVLIIGAGKIGQAIGRLLNKADRCEVLFWDKDGKKVFQEKTLPELAAAADVVFLAVPSRAVRDVLGKINKVIGSTTPVIVLAKGLEADSGKRMDGVLRELIRKKQVMLLFGPMLADEIVADKCTAAVLAAHSVNSARRVAELFNEQDMFLYLSRDVRGVALAGVLKNIYAVGLGIAHGLNLGSNFRGWYVAQACSEMSDIIRALGGKKDTVYGAAGLGDLVATGFSDMSRNHQAGFDLTKVAPAGVESEGTNALPVIYELLGGREKYGLLDALYAVVVKKAPANKYFPAVICGD